MASIDNLEIKISATSDKASDAITRLISSIEKLDAALSKLNIKGFSSEMKTLSNAMDSVGKHANDSSEKLKQTSASTKNVGTSFRVASAASSKFVATLKNIIPHAKSLSSVFMGLYAKLWLIRRVFSAGLKAINYASDLTEVENVVAHTFEGMSYKLEDFAKTSRETFGLSELSAKKYASQFQSMLKTMGITSEQVRKVNESLAGDTERMTYMMSKGYEVVSDDISDMSINLTKLSADMASFYNQEAADTASRLQAGVIAGQSRALRQYGIDLTLATLQEYAYSRGIQQSVSDMTQAQKALLRYQYAMERLSHVQGDFSRTMYTWHNQIVMLKQSLQALGGIIGQGLINAFKPAIMKINAAMNTLIKLVEKAMNAIGKLLGWQIEIQEVGTALEDLDEAAEGGGGGGGSGGAADDMEDTADAADDAADGADDLADNIKKAKDAAKKLKDYTLGIDELNIFHPDEETEDLEDLADAIDDVTDSTKKEKEAGGGSGGGGGAGSGSAAPVSGGGVSFKPYESDIDSWYELGQKISDAIADALEKIDWNTIKAKAKKAAESLAELLNGAIDNTRFWKAIGRTIAEGLNTALTFIDTFLQKLHWFNLGKGLGDMITEGIKTFDWKLLGQTIADGLNAAVQFLLGLGVSLDFTALGEGIATAINTFFETFDFKRAARTLNVWVDNLGKFISSFLETLDVKTVFDGLKTFFSNLEPDTVLTIIGIGLGIFALNLGKAIGAVLIEKMIEGLVAYIIGVNILKSIGDALLAKIVTGSILLDLGMFVFTWQGTPSFDVIVGKIWEFFSDALEKTLSSKAFDFLSKLGAGIAVGAAAGSWFPGAGTVVGAIIGAIVGAFTSDAMQPVRDKIVELATNVGTWFEENVKPWFTAEKWQEIGANMKEGLSTKWEEFRTWWSGTAIVQWWDSDVAPWFTAEKWTELGNKIKDGISAGWDAFKTWWAGTGFAIWWTEDVEPWFTVEKWQELGANIKGGIEGKWNEFKTFWQSSIGSWWTDDVEKWFKLETWLDLGDSIVSAIQSKWDELVIWWGWNGPVAWWDEHVAPWFTLEKWQELGKSISSEDGIIGGFVDMVSDWQTRISNWWTNDVESWFTLEKWKTLGANIVAGIKSGLNSGWDTLKSAITKVATDTMDTLSGPEGFDEGSPSKKAKTIGEYFMEGLFEPFDIIKYTIKILSVASKIISTFETTLGYDKFVEIGTNAINGFIDAIREGIVNLPIVITEALTLLFEEILPPYFSIEMWEPLFTMLHEMFIEQFELFRAWFTDEAMTIWWDEDLASWFTAEKWDATVFTPIKNYYTKAWNAFLTFWRTSMKTWWAKDIIPWFLEEKWFPDVFDMIETHYKKAWESFLEWWRKSMKDWWENDVKPWFTWAKWNPDVFDQIKSHYESAWDTFLEFWRTSMQSWWDEDVKPWFEKDKWNELFMQIYDVAEEVFTAIAEVIEEKMQEAVDACADACQAMTEMIERVVAAIDAAMAKMQSLMSMMSALDSAGGIPMFAAGGYPSTGSLFIANEAGPELIGTINGNTAVAPSGEITGIREAVYATGQAETQLLSTLIGLAQAILDKDPVLIGDRDIAEASIRGQANLGWSLIS